MMGENLWTLEERERALKYVEAFDEERERLMQSREEMGEKIEELQNAIDGLRLAYGIEYDTWSGFHL